LKSARGSHSQKPELSCRLSPASVDTSFPRRAEPRRLRQDHFTYRATCVSGLGLRSWLCGWPSCHCSGASDGEWANRGSQPAFEFRNCCLQAGISHRHHGRIPRTVGRAVPQHGDPGRSQPQEDAAAPMQVFLPDLTRGIRHGTSLAIGFPGRPTAGRTSRRGPNRFPPGEQPCRDHPGKKAYAADWRNRHAEIFNSLNILSSTAVVPWRSVQDRK
jgi:hypothetical protein